MLPHFDLPLSQLPDIVLFKWIMSQPSIMFVAREMKPTLLHKFSEVFLTHPLIYASLESYSEFIIYFLQVSSFLVSNHILNLYIVIFHVFINHPFILFSGLCILYKSQKIVIFLLLWTLHISEAQILTFNFNSDLTAFLILFLVILH